MRTLVIRCGTVACKMFSRRTVRTAISRLGVSSSPSKTGAPRRPTSRPAPSVISVFPLQSAMHPTATHDGVDAINDPHKVRMLPPSGPEISMRAFGTAILLETDMVIVILSCV